MSRPWPAVRCAVQLMLRAGFVELLRRLVVIVVEDAILHPLVPLLVWLCSVCAKKKEGGQAAAAAAVGHGRAAPATAAQRGAEGQRPLAGKDGVGENRMMAFPPTLEQVNAVLRLVFDVAAVTVRDQPPRTAAGASTASSHPPPSLSPCSADAELSDEQRAQVKALLVRAHAGGMAGDVDLLRRSAAVWSRRFRAEKQQPLSTSTRSWLPFLCQLFAHSSGKHAAAAAQPASSSSTSASAASLSSLSLLSVVGVVDDDVLLSAIDQHCSPLIDLLKADNSPVRDAIMERVREKQQRQQSLELPHAANSSSPSSSSSSCHVDVVRMLGGLLWRYRSSVTNKRPLLQTPTSHRADAQEGENGEAEEDEEAVKDRLLFERIRVCVDQISRRLVAKRMLQRPHTAAAGSAEAATASGMGRGCS